MRGWALAVMVLAGAACTTDEASVPAAGSTARGTEVAATPTPGSAAASALTLCDAVAAAPMRWLDDALVTLQLWIDAFTAVEGAPGAAAPALERLVAFGEARLTWNLTGEGDRPPATAEVTADRRAVVATAVSTCADLPLVFGPDRSQAPPWTMLSPDDVVARCADDRVRIEAAVEEYRSLTGTEPGHQAEVEEVVATFFGSDAHGVVLDGASAVVVPVPAGACDAG